MNLLNIHYSGISDVGAMPGVICSNVQNAGWLQQHFMFSHDDGDIAKCHLREDSAIQFLMKVIK